MTKPQHPARRARAFTGVASAVALVAMVAGFELSAQAEAPPAAPLVRSRSAVVPRTPVAAVPAAPAPAPAPADPAPAAVDPAPAAPAAPAPVVVAPPPAPVTPPSGTSGGSGN